MSASLNNIAQTGKVFEIPEIMQQIACYTNASDLPICARVSKSWYQVFIALQWEHISMGYYQKSEPTIASIEKHSNLIMRLSIECKSVQRTESVLGLHFPCLQKFELRGLFMSQLLFSPLFLSINSTIENLRIDIAYRVPDHVSFWETLSNLTKLKALEVSMITLTNESVDAFRRILCRLERVKFNLIALPDNIMENVESVSNLKYLSLRNIDFAKPQVPIFVEKSTLLEHLELSKYGNFEPLMGGMRRFHWPNLHSLSLTETMLDSIQLQQIFCSLTRLTELTLSSSTWDIESFNALSRHFATLEILHDLDSITFTSVMINTVLCSCINLKVLAAPEIKGIDIINGNQINGTQLGGEWVCTQLSTFIIQISTEGVDSQIPILEEMSRLTGLKILNTRGISDYSPPHLSLSLDNGLDILKSLKKIEKIFIAGENNTMTESDIKWILRNWTNLKSVYGNLHHDKKHCIALRNIIRDHNIYAGI